MSLRRESKFVLEFGQSPAFLHLRGRVWWHLDADECVHVVDCAVDGALQRVSINPVLGTSCSTESVLSDFFAAQCRVWLIENHRGELRKVAEMEVDK